MYTYWVIVKTKNEPGAGVMTVQVGGENTYQAIQIAKALYGPLLISESVIVKQ